ncbi:hypothetical protein YPPY13_0836, partial [Yersinia pestis PY-13]|jgi:hypothetical protein
MLA